MAKFIHEGDQKKKYVKQMFNDISSTYDIINIISSFGIDRYWRYKLVNKIKMTPGQKLLDVATGTGDVAFGFYKKYDIKVIGLDIAKKMISIARNKAKKPGSNENDHDDARFERLLQGCGRT